MTGNSDRLTYLYRKYINGTCTEVELQEFFEYIGQPGMKEKLEALADEHLENILPGTAEPPIDWEYMYSRVTRNALPAAGTQSKVKRLLAWPAVAAASIIVLMAATGLYFLFKGKQHEPAWAHNRFQNDLPPGNSKAVLTLANGTSIALYEGSSSFLSQLENTKGMKLNSGELVYEAPSDAAATAGYNTLTTPRGGQFRLVLPDGSKVWLNAASSITYPVTFTGSSRTVTITGEAYLEVARNPEKPFKVIVNGMEVTVLGTCFNINAYTDEAGISTTLLEGAVRVSRGNNMQVLQPGQQAQLQPNGTFRLMPDTDTAAVTAWKNGMFAFNGEDIASIMRQVNRWYDAEIVYTSAVSQHFVGSIPRDVPVSKLLTMLELTGRLRFRIEGKKIIVTQP